MVTVENNGLTQWHTQGGKGGNPPKGKKERKKGEKERKRGKKRKRKEKMRKGEKGREKENTMAENR